MKLTNEQQAILDFVQNDKGNLLIEANAGCGKTSTILHSLNVLPQQTALLCAFNKRIADELVQRMPSCPKTSVWKAQTFHAAGLRIISHHKKGIEVKSEATEELINNACALFVEGVRPEDGPTGKSGDKISFQARRAAVRLLRTLKDVEITKSLAHARVVIIGYEYDLFQKLSNYDIDKASTIARLAYEKSQDLKSRTSVDFCDMTWLPVVLGLKPPSRYQAVFIDESQDLSLSQFKLIESLVATNGRIIAVGDPWQEIYQFRSADGAAIWKELKDKYKATTLPLTTTFRCSEAVVSEANQLVPSLKAKEDASKGSIFTCKFEQLPSLLGNSWEIHTFVLSRNNADLLKTALYLWKAKISFQLTAGKEIVEPLYEIIDKLDKLSKDRFRASLTTWFVNEMHRAETANASAWAERIEDQHAMLLTMLDYAEPVNFKRVLGDILGMNVSGIVLSTVHKVKGLEADRVYLLRQTFARYQTNRRKEISQEDLNIEYVGITRAKEDLIWVEMPANTSQTHG